MPFNIFTLSTHELLILFFFCVMGFSVLAYVLLDGYDLGVGILLPLAQTEEQNLMLSSIGPFWDANETWLVLGVGILLVAFPLAHGTILTALYVPVFIMLVCLVIRGCAFDFRLKSKHKTFWTKMFFAGSLGAAASQGFILGWWIIGFSNTFLAYLFAALISICVPASYALLGCGWLLMKMPATIKKQVIVWAKKSLSFTLLGIVLVSIATPFISPRVFSLWFSFPNIIYLSIVPLMTGALFFFIRKNLIHLQHQIETDKIISYLWSPFLMTVGIFILSFLGLGYSTFPFLVLDKITIWQGASSEDALYLIFWGVIVVVPTIVAYTILSYKIFFGEASHLEY